MSAKEALATLLDELPEDRLREILDFLAWRNERDAFQRFGLSELARAYGPDEPEYSMADVKRGTGE